MNMSSPIPTRARMPPELVKMILDDLPREDLFSARFLCKGFAAVAAVSSSISCHSALRVLSKWYLLHTR